MTLTPFAVSGRTGEALRGGTDRRFVAEYAEAGGPMHTDSSASSTCFRL